MLSSETLSLFSPAQYRPKFAYRGRIFHNISQMEHFMFEVIIHDHATSESHINKQKQAISAGCSLLGV